MMGMLWNAIGAGKTHRQFAEAILCDTPRVCFACKGNAKTKMNQFIRYARSRGFRAEGEHGETIVAIGDRRFVFDDIAQRPWGKAMDTAYVDER